VTQATPARITGGAGQARDQGGLAQPEASDQRGEQDEEVAPRHHGAYNLRKFGVLQEGWAGLSGSCQGSGDEGEGEGGDLLDGSRVSLVSREHSGPDLAARHRDQTIIHKAERFARIVPIT
jgi:hypothetical protein